MPGKDTLDNTIMKKEEDKFCAGLSENVSKIQKKKIQCSIISAFTFYKKNNINQQSI